MAKSFKLRLCRVIPSFHSCRSKDPSTLPENPAPSFLPLSPKINGGSTPPLPAPPRPSKPHFLRRYVSSAITTVGCGGPCSKSTQINLSDDDVESVVKWRKEDRWHVVDRTAAPKCRKIYNTSVSATSDDDDLLPPPPPPPPTAEKKKKKKKRRSRRQRRKAAARMLRLSTSSADSGFYFSSEGGSTDHNIFPEKEDEVGGGGAGGETETLVSSSRSFCTDSSSDHSRKKKNKKRDVEEEVRLSVFKRLMPCGVVEGKVRESFAVVKRSEEPYEDFKRSMLEMILEKNMFEREELEHLLHCFLSLNARHHHGLIVGAFSEIWETLFCRAS